MSSVSEDDDSGPSLKELVTKNLESNGILGKLQAQLRASIFLLLEEEYEEKNIPLTNKKAHDLLATPVGKIAITLIQDFLQCLNLDFTLTVFCPETKSVPVEHSTNREELNKELGNSNVIQDGYPYLFKLIEELNSLHNGRSKNNEKKAIPSRNPPTYDKESNLNFKKTLEVANNDSHQISNKDLSDSGTYTTENNSTNDDISEELQSSTKSSQSSGKEVNKNKSVIPNNESEIVSQISDKSTNISSSTSKSSTTKNTTSVSKTGVENGDSSQSSNSNSSSSGKTLSGIEKEYEEEGFSSMSDANTLQNSSKSSRGKASSEKSQNGQKESAKVVEDQSEIEEAVETAEDIEEDITSLDDLLSSNSEISNVTKDITLSKDTAVIDYEETL